MAKRYFITPGDGDPRHGTANGYNNLGCRCPECTEAWAVSHCRYMNADPLRLEMHALRERQRRQARLRRST